MIDMGLGCSYNQVVLRYLSKAWKKVAMWLPRGRVFSRQREEQHKGPKSRSESACARDSQDASTTAGVK